MKYFVVQEKSAEDLADVVNEMLRDGWKLQGGIGCIGDQGCWYFCQAMIKE